MYEKTLSLILAALLLASSVVSCGKTETEEPQKNETNAVETAAPETKAPATEESSADPAETEASAPTYDPSLITENGVAKAHIVLPDGASALEKTAADELVLHLKKVSGADIAVVNAAQTDSLPIIIATPDSMPELEELFPEDLSWLRTLKEDTGRCWADDGFAIRSHDGKIYIFGATAVGSLNGTYDFIEENLGVIWVGGTDAGIIYDEMPTITTVKTDYREKSPFTIRYKYGAVGVCLQRNKHYVTVYPYGAEHSVKSLILSSPTYDPNIDEYWDTTPEGVHMSPSASQQVNFWSQLTADTIAASVIAQLDSFSDADRPKYFNVGLEDILDPCVYPEMLEPFEYAPGQFVNPEDEAYLSTVYFTFINRIARKVAEKYPDVFINTIAYMWVAVTPRCELEKNVSMWYCPSEDDFTLDSFDLALELESEGYPSRSSEHVRNLERWEKDNPETPKIIYNYYFVHYVAGFYERPIWYKLQNDFRYFAEHGVIGTTICGAYSEGSLSKYLYQNKSNDAYAFTYGDAYAMNLLTYWLYYKLLWNPYEDVDALIEYFCDKVYGDASDEMKEYYSILHAGWDEGTEIIQSEFNAAIMFIKDQPYYYDYFLDIETADGVYVLDALKDALTRAYEAADEKAKEFIRRPYEVFQDWESLIQ